LFTLETFGTFWKKAGEFEFELGVGVKIIKYLPS
jgi:hypothetical protein